MSGFNGVSHLLNASKDRRAGVNLGLLDEITGQFCAVTKKPILRRKTG
jgi:hypothetical protein